MTYDYLQSIVTSIQSVTAPMRAYLVDLYEKYESLTEGTPATYLNDPTSIQAFGICAVTVDGQVFEAGDDTSFVMQSLSRGLIYGLALEDWGREFVSQRIGMKPIGDTGNAIVLDEAQHRPHNPLITTGAMVTTSLIKGNSLPEQLKRILAMMGCYTGREPQINIPVFLDSKTQGNRERAIACFLQQFGLIEGSLDNLLELYFLHNALMVNSCDLAMIAATLANGGINPVTGKQAISAEYVQDVTSMLLTCGMDERSGEWTHRVGIPAQGSTSGGMMAIVPQKLGLGVFSPLLNQEGKSIRGIRICEELSKEQRLHLFDIYEKNQTMQKYIEQVEKITAVAAALENNQDFDLDSLDEVTERKDELGQLARVFTKMVRTIKAREQQLEELLTAFGRFVPHEFLRFLNKQSIVDVQLGDHVSKEMAVMFSDIRSFTAFSERLTPQETFDFVNAYLRSVSPEIRGYNGFVVKFLGDGMMAVFPDGVDDAVAAGIAKFKKVQAFNQERAVQGYSSIHVGMGIHVGNMMVGMVGEYDRIQGDTLSDTVNLTARLEGLTKYYGVSMVISGDVLQRLKDLDQYKIRFLDRAIVKGRTEPIAVYEVLDVETQSIQTLKLQTLADFEKGQEYYSQGDLNRAQVCFEQVLSVNPLDETAKLYLERIQQLRIQGIPQNWSGVWIFTQK